MLTVIKGQLLGQSSDEDSLYLRSALQSDSGIYQPTSLAPTGFPSFDNSIQPFNLGLTENGFMRQQVGLLDG